MTPAIKFKRDTRSESGVHGRGDSSPAVYVEVNGKRVGVVRKRSEWYGNLGRRGVCYRYFDFFRLGDDGRAVYEVEVTTMRDGSEHENRGPLASASKRAEAVSEGLALIGLHEAARAVDAAHADFVIRREARL